MIESAVADLPEPDSPTSAVVRPRLQGKADAVDHGRAALPEHRSACAGPRTCKRGRAIAHRRIVRGSSASRTPSPRKLNASDTTRMAMPGRIVTCGSAAQHDAAVGDHRAPVRGRRLHAEAEEAQAGADDDHQSHQRRRVDDDRRKDVRQHVARE